MALFFRQQKVSCRELLCQVTSSFFFSCRAISNKGAAAAVNSPVASYATMQPYSTSGEKDTGRQSKFTPGERGKKENRQIYVRANRSDIDTVARRVNPILVNTICKERALHNSKDTGLLHMATSYCRQGTERLNQQLVLN